MDEELLKYVNTDAAPGIHQGCVVLSAAHHGRVKMPLISCFILAFSWLCMHDLE